MRCNWFSYINIIYNWDVTIIWFKILVTKNNDLNLCNIRVEFSLYIYIKIKIIMIKNINFTENELSLLSSIINGFGSGRHPYSDKKSISYFRLDYVRKIINKNDSKIIKNLKEDGNLIFDGIKTKLLNN